MLAGEPEGDHLRSNPVLPRALKRLEVRGVLGRWGREDVSAERPDARPVEEIVREWLAARPEYR